MTWDELTDLLTKLGEENGVPVYRAETQGLETIAMHIGPVAWFISMRMFPVLNVGVYEGDEHRLVGTGQVPLAELTPEFVRERVEVACGEAVRRLLDPDAVREFFEIMQRQRARDVDPGRLRDVDQGTPSDR